MATFKKGNMLNHLDKCNYACITTNSMVKRDKRLVMGRGIAQQVRDMFYDIDLNFGEYIADMDSSEYNLIRSGMYPHIVAFQVKYNWADKARLDLIERSCEELTKWAEIESDKTFFLNFPGIGNGQLSREEVLPLVEKLPDNITLWEL